MNMPDAKKRKKKRVACRARLIYSGPEAYPLSAFSVAAKAEKAESESASTKGDKERGPGPVETLLAERGADRSKQFFKAVTAAIDAGMDHDTFEEIARKHPEGCAEK